MLRIVLRLMICMLLPVFTCEVHAGELTQNSHSFIPPELLQKQAEQSQESVSIEIPYAFFKLTISPDKPKVVLLDHPPIPDQKWFSFTKIANAFVQLDELHVRLLEAICNRVNRVESVEELKQLVSPPNYALLEQKKNEGIPDYMVLTMIKNMRPNNIRVMDALSEDDRITLSVTGESQNGPMNGVIYMANFDGHWMIEREEWYEGYANYEGLSAPISITPVSSEDNKKSLLSEYSTKDYKLVKKKKLLALTKIPHKRDKRAFTFVFILNRETLKQRFSKPSRYRVVDGVLEKPKPYIHLLWSGPSWMLRNQHFIKGNYPLDVSIAPVKDGFAADEVNLILPKKKPKAVRISWLMAF